MGNKSELMPVKLIILFLTIIGPIGFFSFCAILGKPYGGSESSSSYLIYNVFFCFASLFIVFLDMVRNLRAVNLAYCQAALISITYILFFIFQGDGSGAREAFQQFGVWAIPALFVGVYFSRDFRWKKIWRCADVLMLLLTVNSTSTALIYLINGYGTASGTGATYQDASYMGAFAFGINLYILASINSEERLLFAQKRVYHVLQYALLAVQGVSTFVCGGRGAFVTLMFFLIIYLKMKRQVGQTIKLSAFITIMGAAGYLVVRKLGVQDVLEKGFFRAISFISASGIEWNHTSGRDIVYAEAIQSIKEKVLFGRGVFSYRNQYFYPHNFFLEVLIQGGIVYLIIWIVCLGILVNKYVRNIRRMPEFGLIGILATYPCVMLMFSGSYMSSTLFWFTVGILIGTKENFAL